MFLRTFIQSTMIDFLSIMGNRGWYLWLFRITIMKMSRSHAAALCPFRSRHGARWQLNALHSGRAGMCLRGTGAAQARQVLGAYATPTRSLCVA